MKNYLVIFLLLGLAQAAFAQGEHIIPMKPDLAGRVEVEGDQLLVTVYNEPLPVNGNAGGYAKASVATLSINSQVQTIQVDDLQANSLFKKRIAIPAALLNQTFSVVLKVNTTNTVIEADKTNNTFTARLNQKPDLIIASVKITELWEGTEIYTAKVRIKNIGDQEVDLAKFEVLISSYGSPVDHLDNLTPGQENVGMGVRYVGYKLAPGALSPEFIVDSRYGATGTGFLIMFIDTKGAVDEKNETNNGFALKRPLRLSN